jgi:hypothetical protein
MLFHVAFDNSIRHYKGYFNVWLLTSSPKQFFITVLIAASLIVFGVFLRKRIQVIFISIITRVFTATIFTFLFFAIFTIFNYSAILQCVFARKISPLSYAAWWSNKEMVVYYIDKRDGDALIDTEEEVTESCFSSVIYSYFLSSCLLLLIACLSTARNGPTSFCCTRREC